jgi:hypothetical protein
MYFDSSTSNYFSVADTLTNVSFTPTTGTHTYESTTPNLNIVNPSVTILTQTHYTFQIKDTGTANFTLNATCVRYTEQVKY